MDLEVKLPMILELDDKGAVNLANNWSVDGRTLHMDVRNHSLCEFKDLGLLAVKSVPGDENDVYIFTKSTLAKVFERHTYPQTRQDQRLFGECEARAWEGVRTQYLLWTRMQQENTVKRLEY